MSKIIDALRQEHKSVLAVLGVLEREVAAFTKLGAADRPDFALMTRAVDYFTDFPDRVHHPKEDLIFARLRRVDRAAAESVGDLVGSHARLALDLRDFAEALRAVMFDEILTRAEFAEKARNFIDHQHLHLAMEEAHFFPVAERTLDAKTWAELEREMLAGIDPLMGGESGERFEALRRNIQSWEAERRPGSRA